MQPFEYLLLLAVVVLGLAVADLAMSLHRLVRAGRRVTWGWLSPLAAFLALVKIITQWWTWYGYRTLAAGVTFELFLGILCVTVLLFMMAAAAFPDELDEQGVDLREYFDRTGRYFFTLFCLHALTSLAIAAWSGWRLAPGEIGDLLPLAGTYGVLIAVAASAALVEKRWWRGLCLVALVAWYLWQLGGQTLSGSTLQPV